MLGPQTCTQFSQPKQYLVYLSRLEAHHPRHDALVKLADGPELPLLLCDVLEPLAVLEHVVMPSAIPARSTGQALISFCLEQDIPEDHVIST